MNKPAFSGFLFLLILIPIGLCSADDGIDPLKNAAVLEEEGKTLEALEIYRGFLSADGGGTAEYAEILFRTASIEQDPENLLSLLETAIPKLPQAMRGRALTLLAGLEEMLGELDESRKHYLQAGYSEDEKDYPALLCSAVILIEMNELEEADNVCKVVLNTAVEKGIRETAMVLLSRGAAFRGDMEGAWDVLENEILPMTQALMPSTLYWIRSLADATDRMKEKEEAEILLTKLYPSVPENALVQGKAGEYPSPGIFFGLLPTAADESIPAETIPAAEQPVATAPSSICIQTGSFIDPENAQYHARDMEEAGFTVRILEKKIADKIYHRVVVPDVPVSEVQAYLIRLKEKGFEGWPLYE